MGVEGRPSKYTRLLVGLFLRWISEHQSVLYSGVGEQIDCYKKDHIATDMYSAKDDMNDDPRRMRVPECVRGIGTRSFRCRNGDIRFFYSDGVAVTMMVLEVGYKEF